jgi:VanZ family protein
MDSPLKTNSAISMSARIRWRVQALPAERWLADKLQRTTVAGVLCILILCSFAVAGLWPFRQIRNQITWISNQPGVHFGKHGIILSEGALPADGAGACSIEMWVKPASGEDSSTLLTFYGPNGVSGFSLQRSLNDLRLDRENRGGRQTRFYISEALPDGKPVFLTLVLGSRGMAVFLDGVPARRLPQLRADPGDCTGHFGVGHSYEGHSSWQGDIRGLAIYSHELTSDQVLASYQSWKTAGQPDERKSGKPKALYLFNEMGGGVIHDHGTAGVSLTIPDRYQNIQPTWLESPQSSSESGWGYIEDLLINIGGFVPFGFALTAFLSSLGKVRWAGAWAAAGGLAVSLTIETLQGYLPTRSSDLTDVLTNTFGTCLGAGLYLLWLRRLAECESGPGFGRDL